jgi:hypothetical protein
VRGGEKMEVIRAEGARCDSFPAEVPADTEDGFGWVDVEGAAAEDIMVTLKAKQGKKRIINQS